MMPLDRDYGSIDAIVMDICVGMTLVTWQGAGHNTLPC